MDPTKYSLSDVREDDIRAYTPGEYLKVVEWYCEHCEERIGYPYMEETHAEICEDAGECPRSQEWGGDACGHVVCKWCHEPASERYLTWSDGEKVEALAEMIGLEEAISHF